MLNTIRFVLIFTIFFTQVGSSFASSGSSDRNATGLNPGDTAMQINIVNKKKSTATSSSIIVETPEIQDAKQAAKIIEKRIQDADMPVLITTDRSDLIKEINSQASNSDKEVYLAPYGDSVSAKELPKWRQSLKAYTDNIRTAAHNDRIGLMIMTVTIGYESFLWFNATNLSTLAQTSNLLYSIILIGTFGIDKDGWARATKPIQNFFKTITGNKNAQWDRNDPRDLATRFTSSFALSLGLNVVRFSLLSMDDIIDGSLKISGMKIQTLIALTATISSFAWAEHIALLDRKTSPTARFFFSRVQEIRALMLGTVAATVKLLHPEVYGVLPWVALSTSGIAGILVYLNAEKIRRWAEDNRTVQKMITKMNNINWLFPDEATIRYCRSAHL